VEYAEDAGLPDAVALGKRRGWGPELVFLSELLDLGFTEAVLELVDVDRFGVGLLRGSVAGGLGIAGGTVEEMPDFYRGQPKVRVGRQEPHQICRSGPCSSSRSRETAWPVRV
jgi:hypothetical protein